MKKVYLALDICLLILILGFQPMYSQSFADKWQFIGVAVEEEGYHVWGSSPILDEDGKIHLFVARWPIEATFNPGWRSHSEIAHYLADKPEGPFRFVDIVLKGTGGSDWDSYGAHNPAIHRIGEKYYLLYIANNNPKPPYHPGNQRIGMMVSESLFGPWEKLGDNGMILAPSEDKDSWSFGSKNGVVNPALLQYPDGRYFLYFKSNNGKKSIMGLAISEMPEGPYIIQDSPVTYNNQSVEDGYSFMYKGDVCLLTTDNHGILGTPGEGILWKSKDGFKFDRRERGFYLIKKYTSINKESLIKHYGPDNIKFERPQVLIIDNEPSYLYVPGGHNIYGGSGTISYVLKFINTSYK